METVPPVFWGAWIWVLLLVVLAGTATRVLLRSLLPQMHRIGLVKENYAGHPLPRAAGVVPGLVACGVMLLWYWAPAYGGWSNVQGATTASVAMLGFVLIGFLDDVVGDRSSGGLSGHGRRLLRGEITTGGLKALFGGLVALAAVAPLSASPAEGILNAFIVAAAANGINLFDVRPGRALKMFFLSLFGLALLSFAHPGWIIVLPGAASFVAFAPEDFGGRAMLGDAGANGAGALLGVALVIVGTTMVKAIVAVGLVLLHVATERGSITSFIEQRSWLRRFDEWGRRRS